MKLYLASSCRPFPIRERYEPRSRSPKAIENSSVETVAYLEQCRAMSGKQLLDAPDEMTFEMGFRIFTVLSLRHPAPAGDSGTLCPDSHHADVAVKTNYRHKAIRH